jgi:cytochrome P450
VTIETDAMLEYPPPRDRRCPFDPPPDLSRIRDEVGLTKVRIWDEQQAWLVSRYQDLKDLFVDDRVSANPTRPGYPEKGAGYKATVGSDRTLRCLDNPDHDVQKRMMIRDFTVRRVEQLRPRIQSRVDELIDTMQEGEPVSDLVRDFAFPVPTMVICELLGVPYEDREFFASRSEISFSSVVTLEEAARAGEEVIEYLDRLVDVKLTGAGDDLISRLVHEQMETGALSRREVLEISRMVLFAGHETTANGIALSVLALLQHPAQLKLVIERHDERGFLSNAVDELMRYLSVTHTGRRRAVVADIEYDGRTIRAGEGLILANNLADRDESVFPNAAELDLERANAKETVAFGWGIHQCPGQYLSRVELQVALGTLFRRLPTLRLAVPFEEIRFKESGSVYGVYELPVTWE